VPRGQEQVRLSRADLPELSRLANGNYGHIVRYRIISEDQNRFSHWSPITQLEVPAVTQVAGDVGVAGNIIQVVWGDEENRPNYDVFVDFDNSGYFYHGTTPIHTYSFLSNISYSSVKVAIQVASIEKERASSITIFESPEINLVELS
jgi:hypothetical protein